MEHIYMRIPERKWSIALNKTNCQISVPSATSKIFKWKETREILLKVAYGRKTTVQIIHRHVQTDLDMIADDFVSRRNQRL
jgi:hypothetical protein